MKNTGSRDGAAVVQLYVRPLKPSVSRPAHELKAFRKVQVAAGQSEPVRFDLGPDAFSYFDVATNAWRVDGGDYELQAANSSREILGRVTVSVGQ